MFLVDGEGCGQATLDRSVSNPSFDAGGISGIRARGVRGPGVPRTSSTIPSVPVLVPAPSLSLPTPQSQGCPSTFSPHKHEIFLRLRGTSSGPVLVSALPFRLSYLPAFILEAWTGVRQRGPTGSSALPVLPLTLHLVQCLLGCSMFYVFLNQDGKTMAPSPS